MPEFRLKLDELRDLQKHELGPNKYEHRPPKRPSRLARRLTPPPDITAALTNVNTPEEWNALRVSKSS